MKPTSADEFRTLPLEQRLAYAEKVRATDDARRRAGDRPNVPMMLVQSQSNVALGKRWRFFFPPDMPTSICVNKIRKNCAVATNALDSVNLTLLKDDGSGCMPSAGKPMGESYKEFKSEDGMLYAAINVMETYG